MTAAVAIPPAMPLSQLEATLKRVRENAATFAKTSLDERIAFLRHDLDRPDIALAEKYRQVMEAYRIEIEYGRKIDTYRDTIAIDGEQREVDILRVGRIALLYQTPDRQAAGFWNPAQGGWEPLEGSEYRGAIQEGMRMANKQASIELLKLPIPAPEAAR